MPSQILKDLSDEIQAKGPDKFAKFFMYASLLNVITATDRENINSATYIATLPKASGMLGGLTSLDIGDLSSEFYSKLRAYGAKFNNPSPDLMKASGMLGQTYFRQSQVADLAYILERMRGELDIMEEPSNSTNKKVYSQLCLSDLKPEVLEFIDRIEALSKTTLGCIDCAVNGSFSVVAAIVGLSVLLHASSALIALLGVGLVVGGVYGAYTYGLGSIEAVGKCKGLYQRIQSNQINPDVVSCYNRLVHDGEDVKKALKCTLFQPMQYAALTAKEQFNLDASLKQDTDGERFVMDRARVSL